MGAIDILRAHPCPTIEWKILRVRANLANLRKDSSSEDTYRRRAKQVVESLAESIHDDKLRKLFLQSKAISDL